MADYDYDVPLVKTSIQKREEKSYNGENPSSTSLPPFNLKPKAKKDNYYYGVRILTGSQKEAGSDWRADIRVTLIGDRARSDGDELLGWWEILGSDNMQYDDFILECSQSLGQVQVVTLENRAKGKQSWYVDFVEVNDLQTMDKQVFPCYHWIGSEDSVTFSSSTALLKTVAGKSVLEKCRQLQLKKRKQLYRWMRLEDVGLPSAIDTRDSLPHDEGFDLVKNVDFFGKGILQTLHANLAGLILDLDYLSGYEEYARLLKEAEIRNYEFSRWTSDVEFGWQILHGVNPVVIRKCEALPAKFPVTDKMVESSLHRGLTLEQEMKAGYVYICDLEIMDGVPCRDGSYCAAPLCLLHVNAANQLKPIAIQLNQSPGEKNPIFLPTDGWLDWITAKMFYLSAHAQIHQLISHFLICHAAMEVYAMGLMRNIPDAHPLYKLLRPHVRYTMAINTLARKSLLGSEGSIAGLFAIGSDGQTELLRRAAKRFSIHSSNIKRNTKERGVSDSSKLPGYYYRDDGFKIWDALEEYGRNIIDQFYSNDAAVVADKEVQSFCRDIAENGFPGYGENAVDGHNFPKSVSTKDELVEICTLIMFTGSAQHAAVNFGQYSAYSFVPNSPFTLHHPPPMQKGSISYQHLMKALPNEKETQKTIVTAATLSSYSPDEIFLGTYPAELFVEKVAKDAAEKLRETLARITIDIEERNNKLDVPYPYLLPGRIPNSITI